MRCVGRGEGGGGLMSRCVGKRTNKWSERVSKCRERASLTVKSESLEE